MENDFDILPLKNWLTKDGAPLIVSGPCSAESREQVLSTARELSKIPEVKIFRAGIWKPRTRPGLFEGVGEKGLNWLREAKEETGLLTTVEVANPHHVELALKYKVDILWVGARTVVNPFSLQELATVLKGVNIPVMVKNPVNPDIELWAGGIERMLLSGINKLVAIHRGFYFFNKTPFRNAPMWEIPIELKRRLPGLPVICDPSHICGKRELLKEVAQKALDLEMDGLMIESHIDPDNALTDPQQQITPHSLKVLLDSLVLRNPTGNIDFETILEKLRSEIDKIDVELIDILSRRMGIIDEIGKYKSQNNITILQLKRWSQIVNDRLNTGLESGLRKDFLQKLLEIVHVESIRRQTEIYKQRNGKKKD
ncbi:MAG: 3-deoxy-7-phosphoheptulonate synthase [Bacteroidetes bacterium]|nr:MAG: 3-deoxy-7-phosphoheptulonate synthase [Bacteroidota bacterium]